MASDVKFYKEDGSFKLRVCGVILSENKILINNCDNAPFFSYPGGHVELGEDTKTAVIREVLEETNIQTEIVKTLANIQLFFQREDGKPFHEIGFYYLLKSKQPLKTTNFYKEEIDKGRKRVHEFTWITLEELKSLDVRPTALKEVLLKGLENQEIIDRVQA